MRNRITPRGPSESKGEALWVHGSAAMSCCMLTLQLSMKYSVLCWNVSGFLLLQQDYFHLLRHNNGRGRGSKSLYKLPRYSWGFWSIKVDVLPLRQNTCRCFISWFIFHMLPLCAGFTSCTFSPLNFLFHVVKMVFFMHRWTALKGKFSVHLKAQEQGRVICPSSTLGLSHNQMPTAIHSAYLYKYIFVKVYGPSFLWMLSLHCVFIPCYVAKTYSPWWPHSLVVANHQYILECFWSCW